MRMSSLTEVARASVAANPNSVHRIDLGAIEAQIHGEWDIIKDKPEYHLWKDHYNSELERRKTSKRKPPDAKTPCSSNAGSTANNGELVVDRNDSWKGLWNSSDSRRHVLDPTLMSQETTIFNGFPREHKNRLIRDDPELEVRNIAALKDLDRPVERRLRRDLQGCGAMHKNVCRIHNCNAEQTRRLDEITKLFSNYIDFIGKERAQSCNEIIALVGSSGDHDDSLLIYTFFLADVRYNPKVQIYIPCT